MSNYLKQETYERGDDLGTVRVTYTYHPPKAALYNLHGECVASRESPSIEVLQIQQEFPPHHTVRVSDEELELIIEQLLTDELSYLSDRS